VRVVSGKVFLCDNCFQTSHNTEWAKKHKGKVRLVSEEEAKITKLEALIQNKYGGIPCQNQKCQDHKERILSLKSIVKLLLHGNHRVKAVVD